MAKTSKQLPSEILKERVGKLEFSDHRSESKVISYREFEKLAKKAEKTFNFDEPDNRPAISL